MGKPLRRARAAPSARFGFRISARSAHEMLGAALRAGTGPQRWGRRPEGPQPGGDILPQICEEFL
jgi:hypothetical protein